jgi:PHP family Zn ribbon phosphoesterase
MKIYTDFHIHTALSPCGHEDMTPNNIVNMAALKGLDAIAITDHNSCENVPACIEVGKKIGIIVVPGMELQTREDVHVVCLFKTIQDAFIFQEYAYEHLPHIENNERIFGKQVIYDSYDNIIAYKKRMLLTSVDISFDEAYKRVKELNGVFIPAHIDRESFGIISSLGFIPDYLDIRTLEYFSKDTLDEYIKCGFIKETYRFIKSSDAHYLGDILERNNEIEVEDLSVEGILNSLL